MSRVESWGGTGVLVVDPDGDVIGGREARDLMAEAFGEGATMVAIPADQLEPAFFDLRSGVAGDILQVSVNYRMRLAIVGDLPEPAASSTRSRHSSASPTPGHSTGSWRHWMRCESGSEARVPGPRLRETPGAHCRSRTLPSATWSTSVAG